MTGSGTRRVTLSDIAERAGVSVMTVSYAFNHPERVSENSRRRVAEASSELGYQGGNPWARSLRTGKSNTLGVVFGEHLTYAFNDPQAAEFLSGVASICVENDLGLTFIPTRGVPEDAERVSAAPVDGYVFWTTVEDDPSLAAVVASGRPCAIQGGPSFPGIVKIGPDDRAAALEMSRIGLRRSRHPVIVSFSLDHSRVAASGYGLPIDAAKLPVTRDRLLGFRDGLEEAGFAWDDAYVIALSRNRRTEAKNAFVALLAEGAIPVDSALCMSDELAAGVLEAAKQYGVAVPADLAVTGWDDGPSAPMEDLTSLRQSLYDQGRTCGEIAAGLTPTKPEVVWSIVERGSTRLA